MIRDKNNNYNDLINEALEFYDFTEPKAEFIRHNENITYSVVDGTKKYLLRIHAEAEGLDFSFFRGDFNRKVLIKSEVDLLNELSKAKDITVQSPVVNKNGEYLSCLKDGNIATVLTWLEGETLVSVDMTKELAFKIGEMVAKLHNSFYTLSHFNRCAYDETFIDKFTAEARAAKEQCHIKEEHYIEIERVLIRLKEILLKEKDNFVIVHSDFSKSNMIYSEGLVSPIDFSMCGYGVREQDIGDLLCVIEENEIVEELIKGYDSNGKFKINREYMDIFKASSIIGYILIHHNNLYNNEKFQANMERWCKTIFSVID